MTNQATFDPFKGYGPKIRNKKKAGDTHGQREHQHPREMHNVRGDLQRRDPETRERGDRARGPAVREVPQPPQGDEPEAAEDGGPVDSPGCPECGNHPLGDDEWDTARGVCECDCHNQQVVGVDDPQWFQRAGEHPWPEKFTRFRPDQLVATDQIVEAFENGARVVMLSAPTGSGKTLVAEMVRRRLATKSLFVCSGKQLQDQFIQDFGEYARVLKGRSNYPTVSMPYPQYTGDDCTGRGCRFCPERAECPYNIAKVQALTATVSVLNTSYLLAEANTAGTFGEKETKDGRVTRRPFVVVDECDTLESALMGYVEFRASARLLEDLGLEPPVKAARTKTVQGWIGSLVAALQHRVEQMQDWDENDVALMRRKRSITRLLEQARGIELGSDEDPEGWGDWIRVYETKWNPKTRTEEDVASFVLKPVVVDDWGFDRLWRHADRWLIMSATIISPDEMADSLGLEREGVPWDVVTMPMPFPKENRPIVMKPVANITYAEAAVEKPKLLAGVAEILDRFSGENILVHTVSYSLTKYLTDELRKEQGKGRWKGRAILAYTNAQERDQAVEAFSRAGGVLLAPSLDRGLDLPDDLCRVVVVAKVPFPALGDRQVSERLRRPGGQVWYGVQVARSLVQMTGRGVRHEEDWATTFILDKQFPRWYREAGRKLLPDWWIEAITSDTKQ